MSLQLCKLIVGISMNEDNLKQVLAHVKVPLEDAQFYPQVFTIVSRWRKEAYAKDADNFKRVCAEEYDDLSKWLDRTEIQESCAVRNVLRTRRLANLLITDKGELNTPLIPKVTAHLKSHLYSLGPHRQHDAKRQEQILRVLEHLQENKELVRLLKLISKPYSHKFADQIIRDTLQLPHNTVVTDAHARRAALSAWMCYLRQSVGSCFATAPAIIVHDDQPEQMLIDINELMGTGRLKRTFGGVEYSVPLSASWGGGDLKRPLTFAFQEEGQQKEPWYSPGMIAAFEGCGLVDHALHLKERILNVKKLITATYATKKNLHGPIFSTPEDLIKRVLMQHFQLTPQDLIDFENRPQGMIQGGLMMQVAQTTGNMGGKGQACVNFYQQCENGAKAFKGLADNALLKSWEYTIASFAETKSEFTRWNLYSSLGLGAGEVGGIGQCLYDITKRKLEQFNDKVQRLQTEYETVYSQVKYLEGRIRGASTEKEVAWIKAEWQSKVNEFHTLEEVRDKANRKAHRFANLFNELIEKYDLLFPNYFQEVYDADMHDVGVGPYDDSPAGFRLLFKHGRANTSQWTPIKNLNEFIDALVAFFTATEPEIVGSQGMEGFQQELGEFVTAIVNHVKTREFQETAFYRMAAAHQGRVVNNPLENLDKIDKKPWVYTSGGTMATLVSCYWKREQKPTEVTRWVENPTELLVFLVDTMKQLPPKLLDEMTTATKKSLLMHSPTHAFLLKPGDCLFKDAWTKDAYTYTWIRDNFINPMEKFWENIVLHEEMMSALIDALQNKVPDNFKPYFRKVFSHIQGPMKPYQFRQHLLETMDKERGLRNGTNRVLSSDDIDSVLYSMLPFTYMYDLNERVTEVLGKLQLPPEMRERAINTYKLFSSHVGNSRVISSERLQEICKATLCVAMEETSSDIDLHRGVLKACRELHYASPSPMLFADSNWVKDEFGFVVNPGNGRFELWRLDCLGSAGFPMSHWEQWLNGSRQDPRWGIYTKPYEYLIV